jgi:tetratricopeptide (TPR) repeat protein
MNPEDMPPPNFRAALLYSWLFSSAFSLVCLAFWLWMAVDCYRRRGGLDYWHYLFFFFPPSCVLYCIVHKGDMIFGRRGTGGAGLFGFGLRSRIARAEHQMRVSGTFAARTELAELYFEAKRYDECEKHFEEAIKVDPKNLDALYYVGLCRLHRNDNAGALDYLQRVMDGNRKLRFGYAWLRYTDCLIANNRRDEALEERRRLCRAFPRPLTEFAYAQILADAGQNDKARETLDEMLSTAAGAPAEDQVWLKRGRALAKTL